MPVLTWMQAIKRGLIITELVFHYLYGLVFPNPATRGIPKRIKALLDAKQPLRSLILSTPSYELSGLYVHPGFQGYGVGRLLVRWGMDQATEEGVPVFISAEERGVRFYEAVGCRRLSKSEYWLDSEGEPIPPEERVNGAWEKANGGVSGCDLVWCPEGVIFGH
jgi:GNAT superfamily N-acetyltransferase